MVEDPKKHSVFSRVLYWTLCTLLIVALFILIFGIFGIFVADLGINTRRSIGLIIGAVGSVIFILAAFKPHSLTSPMLFRKMLSKNYEKQDIFVWHMILGFSFCLGGFFFIALQIRFSY